MPLPELWHCCASLVSLCPRRSPLPWLSTTEQASARPWEAAQGDPSRDASALGEFRAVVRFGQQEAERVPRPCKNKQPQKGRSRSIALVHVNAAQALPSCCWRGLPGCRIPPCPCRGVVGTRCWGALSSAALPVGFERAAGDLLSLSNGWA